jgi:L-arabinose isomerase
MFQEVRRPRIAVLGLSLGLYREALPDFPPKLTAVFGKFCAELAKFAEVVHSRACFAQDEVAAGIRAAEADDLDAVVLVPVCYTASLMTLLPALRTPLPLVVWNTQEAREITPAYCDDDLMMNHVTQGTQDVTNVLFRGGRRFGMETGHYQDPRALERLAEWLAACRAMKFARRLRVGLLGLPFQDMGDFGVDETMLAARWGPYTAHLGVSQFIECLKAAQGADVSAMIDADRARFDVAPDLTREIHEESARLEWAMRKLVAEARLDALSMNFLEFMADGRSGSMPFLGINKLMGEGMGYAGEGNVTAAAHMAQVRQLCGEANFTEIYTVDYIADRMMMTHMQECNPALARRDRKVRLVRKEFWAPGVRPYAGMHFMLEPGPVTLTNVTTDGDGKFRYIVAEAEVVDMPPLENFQQPHWLAQVAGPVGDFLTRYSLAGGTHHLVSAPGRRAEALRKLAYLQGFEFVMV